MDGELTRYRDPLTGKWMVTDGEDSMPYDEYARRLRNTEEYRWHMADDWWDRHREEQGGNEPG